MKKPMPRDISEIMDDEETGEDRANAIQHEEEMEESAREILMEDLFGEQPYSGRSPSSPDED